MGKFINLVKNEYVKLIHKAGTWVMVIIILVACIGMPCIALYAKHSQENSMDSYSEDVFESYRSEVNYLKEAKTEGWEKGVEQNQYLIDNKITEYWMIDASTILFDVKYNAADYNIGNADAIVNTIDTAIKGEDWKTFFETAVELSERYEGLVSESAVSIYKHCLEDSIAPYEKNWKYNAVETLENSKQQLKDLEEQKAAGQPVDYSEMQGIKDTMTKYQYRIDNNIDFDVAENDSWMTTGTFNFWSVFGSSTFITTLIGVFVIIIAGGIISGEFSSGTIKFLMINPVKRWKIIASKYFSSISIGFVVMLGAFIVSMFASMILFGTDHMGAAFLAVSNDKVKEISGFLYIAKIYLLNSINFVVMGSLAFAISSLFRSSALAIGISVMAMFGGNTIVLLLSQLQFDWGRYLIFSNLDINGIINGTSMFAGQTLTTALAVIAVHMIIFLLTAWDGFTKREV